MDSLRGWWGILSLLALVLCPATASARDEREGDDTAARPVREGAQNAQVESPTAKPSATAKAKRMTRAEARRAADEASRREYTDEQIHELGKQLAIERGKTYSWLVNPTAQVVWIGARAYFAHGWETRRDVGRPATEVTYGAEIYFNPWAGLDLVGRIGGASHYVPDALPGTSRAPAVLDASAGARWTVAALVPITLGWGVTRHVLELPGPAEGQTLSTPADAHHGFVAAGFTIRGASLETGCRIGTAPYHSAPAADGSRTVERGFSAICGVGLLTPALVGF